MYSLYLIKDNEEIFYGSGNIDYMMELLNDYISINNLYGHNEVKFKISKFE